MIKIASGVLPFSMSVYKVVTYGSAAAACYVGARLGGTYGGVVGNFWGLIGGAVAGCVILAGADYLGVPHP